MQGHPSGFNQIPITSSLCSEQTHSDSVHNQHNYFEQYEPGQFNSINKIYQLHSAINKLSIEKQKSMIAYANAVSQGRQMAQMYQNLVTQMQQRIKEKDRTIQGLRMLVDDERQKLRKAEAQRDQLQKFLDTIPSYQSARKLSINLLIVDYQKMKSQIKNKIEQVSKLTGQNKQLQIDLMQAKAEKNALKQNYEQQIKYLRESAQNQKVSSRNQLHRMQQQLQQKLQAARKYNERLSQKQKQQQQQNKQLDNKLYQSKQVIKNLKKLQLELELQLHQSLEVCKNQQNSTIVLKYEQLIQNYNAVLDENSKISESNFIKLAEIANYKLENSRLKDEVDRLKQHMATAKQVDYKIQNYMNKLQNETLKENEVKSPNDNLAKLHQIVVQSSKQKKLFDSQLSALKRQNASLDSKLTQKQKQVKLLKQRLHNQQESLQSTQSANEILVKSVASLQSQVTDLKLQVQKYILLNQQTEFQLQHLQDQNNRNKVAANQSAISSQKYQKMAQSLVLMGRQKSKLIQQNITIRKQTLSIETQLIQKIKALNKFQFQMRQLKKKESKYKCEIQQYVQRIKKQQNKIEKIRQEAEQEKKKMQQKMDVMKQCVGNIKKQRAEQQKQEIMNIKRSSRQVCKKVYNVEIKPKQYQIKINAVSKQEAKFNASLLTHHQKSQSQPQNNSLSVSKTLPSKGHEHENSMPEKGKQVRKNNAIEVKNQIRQIKRYNIDDKKQQKQSQQKTKKAQKSQQKGSLIPILSLQKGEQATKRRVRPETDRVEMRSKNKQIERIIKSRSKSRSKQIESNKLDKIISQLKRQNSELSKQSLY